MARRVLVVSTVEHGEDVLHARVGAADEIKVVVPVVRQGALGENVEAVAGEADVGLAVRDALATFPADEIVVAVRPSDEEGLVESLATDSAPQRSVEGVPVSYVVIAD